MRVRGVLVHSSWTHIAREVLEGKVKPSIPFLEIVDLRSRNASEITLEVGSKASILAYHQVYCTFEKPGVGYCLNVIEQVRDRLPICKYCRLEIPSIKCLMGEPQCSEKEAPKTAKCVKSGVYTERCRVPRYHYMLIYPLGIRNVYLKVGIQRETTFPSRILEQGALVSVIYAKTPNIWQGRKVEVLSRNFLAKYEGASIQDLRVYHVSEKKKSLVKAVELLKFIRKTPSSLEAFFGVASTKTLPERAVELGRILGEKLAKEFSEYALGKVIVLDNLKIYKIDEGKVQKASRVQEVNVPVKEELSVKGEVVGWLGSFLLLYSNGNVLVLDIRRLYGRLVEIELEQ